MSHYLGVLGPQYTFYCKPLMKKRQLENKNKKALTSCPSHWYALKEKKICVNQSITSNNTGSLSGCGPPVRRVEKKNKNKVTRP